MLTFSFTKDVKSTALNFILTQAFFRLHHPTFMPKTTRLKLNADSFSDRRKAKNDNMRNDLRHSVLFKRHLVSPSCHMTHSEAIHY